MKLTFEIDLQSDYHVGAGHGIGLQVDSALLRDHSRTPILRGTMIVGLLRDGLESLFSYTQLTAEQEPLCERLFGSARHPKRWVYSTARPTGPTKEEKSLTRWGGQDVSRVRIDPRTRRAAQRKLFREEEGSAHLGFQFTAECPRATPKDQEDALWLVAAARMVRHLGSARRRGRGLCLIYLKTAEDWLNNGLTANYKTKEEWTNRALDLFEAHCLNKQPVTNQFAVVQKASSAISMSASPAKPIRFQVIAYAAEPVIIAKRSESSYTYDGQSFVPGVALLGAFASQAAHRLGLNREESDPDSFVTMFFREGMKVSGLMPANQQNFDTLYPTIFAPLDLVTGENYSIFREETRSQADTYQLPASNPADRHGDRLKPAESFLTVYNPPSIFNVTTREEAHIYINPETGRVFSGRLYEYVGLEAGQWFLGELEFANQDSLETFQNWTGFKPSTLSQIRLGKAIRRGYGLISFMLNPVDDSKPFVWTALPLNERVTSSELTLTFLTDTILTDPWGRFYRGIDKGWLAASLGVMPNHLEIRSEKAQSHIVDGFHAQRGLPRWRDEAVVAGSAVSFKITTEGMGVIKQLYQQQMGNSPGNDLAALHWKLNELELQGVGLRRHEGFGRIAFNHPVYICALKSYQEALPKVRIPQALRIGDQGSHTLQGEADFRERWLKILEDAQLPEPPSLFANVARVLVIGRTLNHEEIKKRLSELKEPAAAGNFTYFSTGKKLAREKPSDPSDIKIYDKLIELLDQLQKEADGSGPNSAKWCIGLEMLADFLAGMVKQEQ